MLLLFLREDKIQIKYACIDNNVKKWICFSLKNGKNVIISENLKFLPEYRVPHFEDLLKYMKFTIWPAKLYMGTKNESL